MKTAHRNGLSSGFFLNSFGMESKNFSLTEAIDDRDVALFSDDKLNVSTLSVVFVDVLCFFVSPKVEARPFSNGIFFSLFSFSASGFSISPPGISASSVLWS